MTAGSLFAGLGGFDLAFERVGMSPAWQVEIDRDCVSVLARHWPGVPKFEDVRKVGGGELEPVDVISFGSPCQDLSVAGKRAGMAGERSGLFFEAIRIVRELRPAFAVWENVPGAFSSHAGRDFLSAVRAFHELGARDIAWRTLDARHWGVAQRRRRVFLVADFRGERAGQILFEPEGCSRNPAAGGEAGADVAGTIGSCTPGAGYKNDLDRCGTYVSSGRGWWDEANAAGTLGTESRAIHETNLVANAVTPGMRRASGNRSGENMVVPCLRSNAYNNSDPTMEAQMLVAFGGNDTRGPMGTLRKGNGCETGGVPFTISSAHSCEVQSHARQSDTARCLDQTGGFAANQGGTVVAFNTKESGKGAIENIAPTLRAESGDPHPGGRTAVVYETLQPQGIMQPKEGCYASADQADARTILRILREKAGEKAFAKWGLGVLDSLRAAKVLQPSLHGQKLRAGTVRGKKSAGRSGDGAQEGSQGTMRTVWQAECQRRASQKWRLSGQQAEQLGAYLSLLSQPGTSQAAALHHLWEAAEGLGLLRDALSAIQEVWRPADGEGQSAHASAFDARNNSTGEVTATLQSHHKSYSLNAQPLAAQKGGAGLMTVRRLTPL